MRKLRLDIEMLDVESFETICGFRHVNRGTVNARGDTEPIDLPGTQQTWPAPQPQFSDACPIPGNTDYNSNYTCFSCKGTCLKYDCGTHADMQEDGQW